MRRAYRVPVQVSSIALVSLSALSLAAMAGVELLKIPAGSPDRADLLQASRLAQQCFEAIRDERHAIGTEIPSRCDPAGSGLIGVWMSPVTSVYGNLASKQTSANPNFAAAIVRMLRDAGVRRGDTVAIGFSGSFPALNVCVLAATETMGVRPLVTTSMSASQWGANCPDLLWLDMEALLRREGLTDCRSLAASLGGQQDRAIGMSTEGVDRLREAMRTHGVPEIQEDSYERRVAKRMELYRQHALEEKIAAYINVGGSSVSVGTPQDKRAFSPGLSVEPLEAAPILESVMARFAEEGVPIIHLTDIRALARHFGLPWRPVRMPEPGEGELYGKPRYRLWLAATSLLAISVAFAAVCWVRSRSEGEDGCVDSGASQEDLAPGGVHATAHSSGGRYDPASGIRRHNPVRET